MADQSIALLTQTPDFSKFDPGTPLREAQTIQTGQTQLQRLNRVNAGEDIQFRSQLIRDAAAHAQDPESWDNAMRAAAKRGAPEAAQYVGRYTPLLQQRLFESYAGAAPGTGPTAATGAAPAGGGGSVAGGLGADDLDRRFQNIPPERMAGSLTKLNLISNALTSVRDQPSWQAALQRLQAAGVPVGQYAQAPFSPLLVQQAYANIQPVRSYLQNRLTAEGSGIPSPLVKNDTKTVSGVEYSVDPYNQTAKPLTPNIYKHIPDSFDAEGRPILYTEQRGALAPAGGGVSVADAAGRIQKAENTTGNPAATNPRSTAMGNGQFIEKTWLDTVKEARPELAKTLNDKQLLALRADPEFSSDMTKALATQNAGVLANAKMPVTTTSLALAHRFGADGALKILNAAPNTPMEDIVSKKVMEANPELAGQTAGSYAQRLIKQVGNDPVATTDLGRVFHKGDYDKPQLVETDDGKGGTNRVLAQQNKKSGQWVTADEKRTPIDANNMIIIPESMGAGGGGRFAGQVMRILNSAKGSTSEISNLVQLPIGASTGWFGGRGQGPSLLSATKEVLANTVTSQEVQDFNTSMIGMSRHLATLETGGMQTNESLVKKFEGLALKEGDSNWTKMRKLGTMRQDAENAIESLLTSPLIGKKQKEFAESLIKDLKAAVPWTPNDVTRLQRAADKNPQATIGDIGKKTGLGTQGFLEGHIYRDAKGNSAKYLGANRWEPVAAEGGAP